MLKFSLSAEQQELQAAVDFRRRKLDKSLAERDETGEFSLDAWLAYAPFGTQGLPIPADLGGGSDILMTALIMEAFGYGCHDNGLIFSLKRADVEPADAADGLRG